MTTTTPIPIHPAEGFYEQVKNDLEIDPELILPRTHEQFMLDRNHQGWLGYTLMMADERKTNDDLKLSTMTPKDTNS